VLCSSGLVVKKAEIVNLLEDHVEDLQRNGMLLGSIDTGKDEQEYKLDFRGYEIKTVKLTLGAVTKRRDSAGWVKVL
jgi:alpha-mannosidase